jgi:hypothetical protein
MEKCRGVINYSVPKVLPILTGVACGYAISEAVQKNYELAAPIGVMSVYGFAADICLYRAKKKQEQLSRRVSNLRDSIMIVIDEGRENGEPIYKSLDGKQTIGTFPDLMFALGGDIRLAASRIGLIIKHAEKGRELSLREIEMLRKGKALLNTAPFMKDAMCDEGIGNVKSMDKIIGDYEKKYKETSSTSKQ